MLNENVHPLPWHWYYFVSSKKKMLTRSKTWFYSEGDKCTENIWLHILFTCIFISFQLLSPPLVFATLEPAYHNCHNKMLVFVGLGINTVLSMNHPLGVTLHSAQSLSCCLRASRPAYWTLDFMARKTFPVLSVTLPLFSRRWNRIVLHLHVQSGIMIMLY